MEKKLKILVLSESYPGLKASSMAYVHSRNQYYISQGHEVEVLSFQAEETYSFEGVNVFRENYFLQREKISEFDLVISHAPNLKNHIRFIARQYPKLKNLVFVIHGHEVLKKINYYPLPFKKLGKNLYNVGEWSNYLYDLLKVKILGFLCGHFFSSKMRLVFVSEWMRNQFGSNLNLSPRDFDFVSSIIPNSVNNVFESNNFNFQGPKVADFITIRSFDNPKYSVDLIVEAAKQNPEFEFHLYGQGTYFKYYECPVNLKVIEQFFNQKDLPAILNQYRAALMPTRLDSQGVMMCEMATFGMPVVTSDLAICKEMLDGFENICFLPNENFKFNAKEFLKGINQQSNKKNKKFFAENTVQRELKLFINLISADNRIKVLHINDIAFVGSSLLVQQQKVNPDYELVEMPKPLAEFPLPLKIFGIFERWSFARKIKKRVRLEGFNLIHIHFVSSALWFLNLKIPIIVHAHGSDVRVNSLNIIRRLLNFFILWRANFIFYSTPDLKMYFDRWSHKCAFVPNPIDCEMFFLPKRVSPKKDILLYSALSEIKGADIAVDALNIIKSKFPHLKISVLGFGTMVNRLDLSNLEVLEKVPRTELPQLIQDYKLILGQFRVGAIGMSDLEALSAEKVVMTYFKFNEVYDEDIPIVNVHLIKDLVEQMEKFINNPHGFDNLMEKARPWIIKFHGVEKIVERIGKHYLSINENWQNNKKDN